MRSEIESIERNIRRRFRGVRPDHLGQIMGDFHHLVQHGLKSRTDFARMAIDPSLDESTRATATWFLARLSPARSSTPVLLKLLTDAPLSVRVEAARSLGLLRSSAAFPRLVAMALNERERILRESSVHALGLTHDRRALDTLLSIAQDTGEPPSLRDLAIEAIKELGVARTDVIQILEALLADPSPQVAFSAIDALGELGGEEVIPALQKLADTDARQLPPFGPLRARAMKAEENIRSRLRGDVADA